MPSTQANPASSTDSTAARRGPRIQGALVILALICLAWRARPDARLHVMFLATAGDAILIQTPAGGFVLIDGGQDPAALSAAIGRRLPFWRRTLDAVVLTGADSARLPGQVAALARYRAGLALAPPLAGRSALLAEWRRLLREAGTPVRAARVGDRLDLGGATLRILAASDDAEAGLVLRLDYGTTSVVFDHGGSEGIEERITANRPRRATLLAFPWQRDPHTPIVAALQPRALLLTDGYEADHPVEQTFVERAVGGAALYHERLNGTIEWISDGTRSWIVTEHP